MQPHPSPRLAEPRISKTANSTKRVRGRSENAVDRLREPPRPRPAPNEDLLVVNFEKVRREDRFRVA